MVVVSESWLNDVQAVTFGKPQINGMVIPTNTNMIAKAILVGRPNSHPFQDRTLSLEQPVKVGRSVARARATPTNAIFDCKVLSRHHAVLWYDCGKFYLQDTKSSNGTFVNNNRLSSVESEAHEVSSGDIVQFGVDVVENNRKVTHGCIIATLKLYLPDGKEAKASPIISEGNRHGLVPLDELYKLNQIIQEASQREQCLETKLIALERVVKAAKRAAEESWQAYVQEERLLSRVAALETQLVQANKGFGDDRLREEINKLQEDRSEYQIAAKEVLRKLHTERLEAVSSEAEQQRARATAENETILVSERLEQTQLELKEIAQKLTEEQKKTDEMNAQLEQREKDYQRRLEAETEHAAAWQEKCAALKASLAKYEMSLDPYNDDFKTKEDLLADAENEESGQGDVKNNGLEEPQQNHINLTVAPVTNQSEAEDDSDAASDDGSVLVRDITVIENCENKDELNKNKEGAIEKKEECESSEGTLDLDDDDGCEIEEEEEVVRREYVEAVDTRTLKYQYQTAQIELKKQIEQLEIASTANKTKIALLEKSLLAEREENSFLFSKSEELKEDFACLESKYNESVKETKVLKERVNSLLADIAKGEEEKEKEISNKPEMSSKSSQVDQKHINIEQLQALEEELVILKERYASINDEKISLNKELVNLHEQFNAIRDRSHNMLFCYIAPLVLMVLYLLISSMFS